MGCGSSKSVTVIQVKSEEQKHKNREPKRKNEASYKGTGERVPNAVDINVVCDTSKDVAVNKEKLELNSEKPQLQEQMQSTRELNREKESPYMDIDEHARKAPTSLKESAEDLINYLSSVSKEPRILVRGIFVWISENIKYDVGGYFGTGKKAPYDSAGVMKCGRSVCGGYANVMEDLCRKANIPVKKLSGFAKGFGHSADKIITESTTTNHAWNAVQLEGKWYLMDSTWGSGNVTQSHVFEKKFKEAYFLANPKYLITSHFPYMDGDMEESMKWQLLTKPVSLPEFSRAVKYGPSASLLGARAVSHTQEFFEMKNELKMIFKSEGQDEIMFSSTLMLCERNNLKQQNNATYGYVEHGVSTILVHPPKVGIYKMNVFGYPVSDESKNTYLMSYTIKCTHVQDKGFEFPQTFANHRREGVILRKPMSGKLKANTEVSFKIEAPYLQTIKAGDTFLEKSGTTFSGMVKTGAAGLLTVFCNRGARSDRKTGILQFIVND